MATSELVVLHHGREGGRAGDNEARPSVFNGFTGGARPETAEDYQSKSRACASQSRATSAAMTFGPMGSPNSDWNHATVNVEPCIVGSRAGELRKLPIELTMGKHSGVRRRDRDDDMSPGTRRKSRRSGGIRNG